MNETKQNSRPEEENIGKVGSLAIGNGLNVLVKIRDVRFPYGKATYEVEPVAGSGVAYVRTNLVFPDHDKHQPV